MPTLEERVEKIEEKLGLRKEAELRDKHGRPLKPWFSVVEGSDGECLLVIGWGTAWYLDGYWLGTGSRTIGVLPEFMEFKFDFSPAMSAKMRKLFDC